MSLGIDFYKADWLAVNQTNNSISSGILTTLNVYVSLRSIWNTFCQRDITIIPVFILLQKFIAFGKKGLSIQTRSSSLNDY